MLKGRKLGEAAWEHWASKGLPVFPCGDNKNPLTDRGFKDAETDKEKVISMFAERGDRAVNIGAVMGDPSGLFAVDFDLYKDGAEDYKALLEETSALPPTRIHKTKNGGLHYIYLIPDGVETPKSSAPHKGVEIKSQGGYIIVPPSHGYEVISDATVEAPSKLIERIGRAELAFRKQSLAQLEATVLQGESFHEALTLIAAKMNGQGVDPVDIQIRLNKLMEGSVAADPNHDRHGRWLDMMRGKGNELARINTSAFKKYNPLKSDMSSLELRGRIDKAMQKKAEKLFGKEQLQNYEKEEKEEEKDDRDNKEFPFERSYNAANVSGQDNKDFLLYPLMMESDVIVLSAMPKAGKTLLSLNVCLHMAAGIPMGGVLIPMDKQGQPTRHPVVYFALEGQGVVRKRIKAWLNHQKSKGLDLKMEDLPLYVVERPVNLTDEKVRQEVADKLTMAKAFFKREGYDDIGLVVFDTLTKAMPGKDQNQVEDTSAAFNVTDLLRENNVNAAVMFVHHNNRSGGVRGSSNILAEPDTVLTVKKLDAKMLEGKQYDFLGLSIYMARAIDDMQHYTFKLEIVEIGKNIQGIMEHAPVLELIEDYSVTQSVSETKLQKYSSENKELFYTAVTEILSDAVNMSMDVLDMHRALRQRKNTKVLSYYAGYLNDNTKSSVIAAWKVLLHESNIPPSVQGLKFAVKDEGKIEMHFAA